MLEKGKLLVISGPSGETLALAGRESQLLLCELDLSQASALRSKKPYTRLRRKELYD